MAFDVTSIYEMTQILEKSLDILETESHNLDIDLKFRNKLEYFDRLSCNMTDKIQSLLYLYENYNTANINLKQYVNKIVGLWNSTNNQVYEKCSKIRMASRTLTGIPLSSLLEEIKREGSLIRDLIRIHESKYDRKHFAKCYILLNKIEKLLNNLTRCDDKLQHYLAISKLIPFLVKLESTVDEYISSIEISPINKSECSELDVFPIVAKLLTGELLDNESMDPYHVLAHNAPRKPVFIIKTKRKTDIMQTSVAEMTNKFVFGKYIS